MDTYISSYSGPEVDESVEKTQKITVTDPIDLDSVKAVIDDLTYGKLPAIAKVLTGISVVALCYHKVAWDDDPDWVEKEPDYALPAESILYASGDVVYVHDLTDADAPLDETYTFSGHTIMSVKLSNGHLIIGTSTAFIVENLITGIQTVYTTSSNPAIVNNAINDLAVTLLPDAPINPATGMRYPTIFTFTDSGLSVIDGTAGQGTVVDLGTGTKYISGSVEGERTFAVDDAGTVDVWENIPTTDTVSPDTTYSDSSTPALLGDASANCSKFFGSPDGLTILDGNAVAHVTKDFSTGLMRGDIKTCLMADTESGTVSDTELVTNGGFDSDSDWHKGNGWTISGGTANHDGSGAGDLLPLTNTIEKGKTYYYEADCDFDEQFYFPYGSGTPSENHPATTGKVSGLFTATADGVVGVRASTYVTSGTIDNISVTEAIADRSVAGNHAQVIGSLTKSPVATGAELMALSGFGSSSYATISEGTDFSVGTGNLRMSCWAKLSTSNLHEALVTKSYNDGSSWIDFLSLKKSSANAIQGWVTTGVVLSSPIIPDQFAKYELVRYGSNVFLYVNGELKASDTNTSDLDPNNPALNIGHRNNNGTIEYPLSHGEIALVHFSATAPTPEQIKADYLAELPMFQENAKCTLSGSSNNVLALSYDDSKDEATVITDVVDTFKGLVNVKQAALTGTGQCVDSGGGVVAIGTSTQASIEKPEIILREELAKQPERLFIPEQFWFERDGSETDYNLPSGYDVWAVYEAGGLVKNGNTDDYLVKDNGNNKYITMATVGTSGDGLCIMGILQ